jgi:transposase
LLRPGSRQRARPCRSKMSGVSACPPNIFQKGYENLVVIFRTGKKSCTWVHVVVSKRRNKVEASNSEQKVCCDIKK